MMRSFCRILSVPLAHAMPPVLSSTPNGKPMPLMSSIMCASRELDRRRLRAGGVLDVDGDAGDLAALDVVLDGVGEQPDQLLRRVVGGRLLLGLVEGRLDVACQLGLVECHR